MTKQKIFEKIEDQIEQGIYPGASLALYQASQWQESYFGLANPQEKKPLKLVWSMTWLASARWSESELWQPFCVSKANWIWICPYSIIIRPFIEKM
ncbi:conserved domain protein [Streptococcus sp. oral taxon 056 str. F0418]|nr:conserved domain protein [Streptococcus sp. oral taxon 056 str. F0418]